jgi:hypothetical protein
MLENFQLVTIQNGTHFHARCPLCGDSAKNERKKRFHLDYNGGEPKWHCFNCNRGSKNFISLYCKVLGVDYKTACKQLFKYDSKKIKARLDHKVDDQAPVISNKPNNFNWILDDCIGETLNTDSVMWSVFINVLDVFRQARRIPPKYDLYIAYRGKYKGRIIIPILDSEGNIIFFQGRALPATNLEPKYLNPVTEKSMIIHNESVFRRDKFIIVTEGLIDAFSIGDQGTTSLGVEMSKGFLKRLLSLTDKGVILVFDNDEPGYEALEKFMKESKYRDRVQYFLMPRKYIDCKDINMLSVDKDINDVYTLIVNNSFKRDIWKHMFFLENKK